MTIIRKKDDSPEIRHVTWVGLLWNVVLTIGKFIGGIFGGSSALVADAVHSASDFATDIAILVGSKYWNLPPDAEHPYGHRRFETLISIGIGFAVCGVAVGIGYKAILALLNEEASRPEWLAAAFAALSIVLKECLFRYTRKAARIIRSQALEANAWHHRSDAYSSIPVLVAVIVAMAFPQLWFADSVGALIVAFFIFRSGIEIAWPGIHQVADHGTSKEVSEKLKSIALSHPKVICLHRFRTRYVGSDVCVDLHIVVDANMSLLEAHDTAEEVERMLIDSGENIVDALVHIDPYDEKKAGKKEN